MVIINIRLSTRPEGPPPGLEEDADRPGGMSEERHEGRVMGRVDLVPLSFPFVLVTLSDRPVPSLPFLSLSFHSLRSFHSREDPKGNGEWGTERTTTGVSLSEFPSRPSRLTVISLVPHSFPSERREDKGRSEGRVRRMVDVEWRKAEPKEGHAHHSHPSHSLASRSHTCSAPYSRFPLREWMT